MKNNVGTIDKVIKILIAIVIAILYFTHEITGSLGIILLVLAAVFVITSLVGFCPLYWTLGLNTTNKKQ